MSNPQDRDQFSRNPLAVALAEHGGAKTTERRGLVDATASVGAGRSIATPAVRPFVERVNPRPEGGTTLHGWLLANLERLTLIQADRTRHLYLQMTPADHADWGVLASALESFGIVEPAHGPHVVALLEDLPLDIVGPAVGVTFQDVDLQQELRDYLTLHRQRLVALMRGATRPAG